MKLIITSLSFWDILSICGGWIFQLPNKLTTPMAKKKKKKQVNNPTWFAAYFVAGADIGKFTMKAASDIRTLNKSLHFQPPTNFYNMNQLASMWESKIGHSIPRLFITEDHLLSVAAGSSLIYYPPLILHNIYIYIYTHTASGPQYNIQLTFLEKINKLINLL